MKERTKWILVLVAKRSHRTNGLLWKNKLGIHLYSGGWFTIFKRFQKIWLERTWNTTFWKVSAKKDSGVNGTSEKLVVFSRTECLKQKFDTSFRPLQRFFGKWNWFSTNGKRDSIRDEIYQFRILLTICPNSELTGLSMPGYSLLTYISLFTLLTVPTKGFVLICTRKKHKWEYKRHHRRKMLLSRLNLNGHTEIRHSQTQKLDTPCTTK